MSVGAAGLKVGERVLVRDTGQMGSISAITPDRMIRVEIDTPSSDSPRPLSTFAAGAFGWFLAHELRPLGVG